MRIIAGSFKGLTLDTLSGDNTRPTKDNVKEAIFSSLFTLDESESFLDLFAGSGAVGIEALSRGVGYVHLNDYNKDAYNVIKRNIEKTKAKNYKLTNLDFKKCLNSLNQQFDYIFVDPPYDIKEIDKVFELISTNNILKDDGIIIFETRKEYSFNFNEFETYKEKTYGITKVVYMRKAK